MPKFQQRLEQIKQQLLGLQTATNQQEFHILQLINPYSPLQKYLMSQLIDQSQTKKQRLLQKVKIIKLNFFFQQHLIRQKEKDIQNINQQ